ncbi:MAG: DUF2062 domain-containing protein [Kiritimatiellia bacterium]
MSWIKQQWSRLRAQMLRDKAPPEFVARGWAIGMFYGCTIPFGFQLLLSLPTAYVLKGSRVGATVGTFITNHFTIFLIYPCQCWLGNRLLGGSISYSSICVALEAVLRDQSWAALRQLGWDLLAAFLLGGCILAAVCVPLTYWGVLRVVRRARARSQTANPPAAE